MKKYVASVAVVMVLLIVLVLGVKTMKTVKSGNTGVVVCFGKVQESILESGFHFVNPIGTKIVQMNNQVQRTDVNVVGASKDLQTITGAISINYILEPSSSAIMYKNVGVGYDEIIIRPAIQETSKAVISKYTAEELITQRAEVSLQMQSALEGKISTYGLTIKEFNILSLDFSEEFNKAIEAKQTAQQNALKAQQDLARIKIEAEQKVAQAEAEAKAYELKSKELTDKMIEMEFISKWDGVLPKVVTEGTSLMDISSMTMENNK